jgi:hypothetical protein
MANPLVNEKFPRSHTHLTLFLGCGKEKNNADAFGNFEANEVIVSAETAGRLIRFQVDEGQDLLPGMEIGIVDTTQLVLANGRTQRTPSRCRLSHLQCRGPNGRAHAANGGDRKGEIACREPGEGRRCYAQATRRHQGTIGGAQHTKAKHFRPKSARRQ